MIVIDKDKTKLDVPLIHSFISNTYWAKGRSIEAIEKTIENSICFGMYKEDEQIGFARVVSDTVVFAYIMDVFVLPEYRGKGYSKRIVQTILDDEELKNCNSWVLKTLDAHGLYEKFGFHQIEFPEKFMEKKK